MYKRQGDVASGQLIPVLLTYFVGGTENGEVGKAEMAAADQVQHPFANKRHLPLRQVAGYHPGAGPDAVGPDGFYE